MTVQVKVCGVTHVDDAHRCVDAGVDAIGVNLWAGSKRVVSTDEAASIFAVVPDSVRPVLVLVNPSEGQLAALRRRFGSSVWLQLHGDESPELFAKAGTPVMKALATRNDVEREAALFPKSELLLDAAVPGQWGGTGVVGDWNRVAQLAMSRRVWLSGGLRPENVAAGVRQCRPYGVDVASGVERDPRNKDPEKIRAFVAAAKAPLGD